MSTTLLSVEAPPSPDDAKSLPWLDITVQIDDRVIEISGESAAISTSLEELRSNIGRPMAFWLIAPVTGRAGYVLHWGFAVGTNQTIILWNSPTMEIVDLHTKKQLYGTGFGDMPEGLIYRLRILHPRTIYRKEP
jgi:hypothetical protein